MSAIQHLLRRWGFVRLSRYGLLLTSDGRVVSTRPVILDDGTGGRVVGWSDDDPAPAELRPWAPPRRDEPGSASQKSSVATNHLESGRRAVPSASAAVRPVAVAREPRVEEDDWEWTIALARARVAADQPPAQSAPQPATGIEYDDYSQVRTTPVLDRPRLAGQAPATVIPVPPLPTLQDMGGAGRLEPVVRTFQKPGSVPPPSPSRFPKGTGTVGTAATPHRAAQDAPESPANRSVGDRTRPGIALPPAARAVELPSVKRRWSPRG